MHIIGGAVMLAGLLAGTFCGMSVVLGGAVIGAAIWALASCMQLDREEQAAAASNPYKNYPSYKY